jgi:hypothetical protein
MMDLGVGRLTAADSATRLNGKGAPDGDLILQHIPHTSCRRNHHLTHNLKYLLQPIFCSSSHRFLISFNAGPAANYNYINRCLFVRQKSAHSPRLLPTYILGRECSSVSVPNTFVLAAHDIFNSTFLIPNTVVPQSVPAFVSIP